MRQGIVVEAKYDIKMHPLSPRALDGLSSAMMTPVDSAKTTIYDIFSIACWFLTPPFFGF
jgi:hypothetical protein